ncbi:Disease resistance protein [Actinidia chinensis var. chinensis]|uniref:Disease resistance protein n=1 Tax=Actinidia chinensis var. chinensis TaxID=1590841 RepID=A0A2R6P0I9_ACTCC|nr:Disease resistance protein [Actinidia chinensis var. chinensis]
MCTPQGIIEHIGCLICDEAVKKAIKAASYVRHYKANLDNLEAEMIRLRDRREIIAREVREAEDCGDEVEAAVSHWQTDVDRIEGGIQELVGQRTAEQNMHCFVCSCPNIKWRYRLGKLAEERTEAVKELTNRHFDRIAHRRPPPPELEFPSNENYVIFDSRTPILNEIMDALNDPKVNTIGVYGLGGVGKTRLVEEVRKQMRENGTFKQAPLAAVSKNQNVKDIQSKLADELFLTLDAAQGNKITASNLMNKFTNGERYLVTLDDIWQEVNLKEIGIPITDGKTGCKVVLTSRIEGLLKKMKVDRSFLVAELSELEALALFKEKVGNSADSPELSLLASKVCQKCKGLPVAINALGAALEGKPVHAWKNALDKLERYMLTYIEDIDPSVFASLRLTYDMLHSKDAKSCFLICCLFPEDAQIPIDELMRHCVAGRLLALTPRTLDEARNAVHTVVDTLKSYSLLSDGREINAVRIHDVIRDIGISIARDEKAYLVEDGIHHWPEPPENGPSYSVISIRSGNINQLPDELAYPQLHTLIFEYSNYPLLKVPDRFFSGMKKLAVLVFNGMCLLPLPSSLAQLENLRMLCLNRCKLGDVKIIGDLKTKLEVLSLRGSDIKALPLEIGQLTSLLLLDLRDCDNLSVIPQGVISKLTKLEELYISDRFDKWEATTDKKQDTSSNASLDELTSLNDQLITLHIHIPDVKLLPEKQLKFENLKRFKISVGSTIGYFDKKFSGSSILKLEGIPLKDEFKALVHKAEVLYVQQLEGLKKVLHDRAGGEVSFSNLRVLIIQSCGNLRYLFSPSCARGLVQLERLEIKSCPMEEMVGFDGEEDEDELTRKEYNNLIWKFVRALEQCPYHFTFGSCVDDT